MKTRMALLEGPGKLSLVEKNLILNDDEVLVRTFQSSICGTDKMYYRGEMPPSEGYPLFIGHEGGGVVEAVGSKVQDYQVGDLVMSFSRSCTFADYFKTKPINLQPVPEGLDMRVASLGEPLACAMHSVLESGVQLGDTVAVVGVGFAGQVMLQGARKKGATKVIAIDIWDSKLALAKKLGADVAVNAKKEDVYQTIMGLTEGIGVDVVFEAAGAQEGLNICSSILRHNGHLVLYSWLTQPVTLNMHRWHQNSFKIITTTLVHHTKYERLVWAEKALRPFQQNLIEVEPLISAEYKLEDIKEAFEEAQRNEAHIKIIIKP
ncbi:MAG: zinc-dependent alcohol dehydrogenase [Bacillota bacterium]